MRNLPVSTEITGYGVSTLVYLHSITRDSRYLERAAAGARFLTSAWDPELCSLPFELSPPLLSYFFDCGIVVRALLSAWRATGQAEFLDVAGALGKSMAADFASRNGHLHPVLSLPGKHPVECDRARWSLSPGCYQLKPAMAWWDLWEATGDARFCELYQHTLEECLRNFDGFLPGHSDRLKVMDRAHAYLYFLEGLLPRAAEKRCSQALRQGIRSAATHLRDIAPEFDRSDVYAQLLRIRWYHGAAGAADRLLEFACESTDARVDGGFYFGRSGAVWEPHVTPVATAFAIEALALAGGAAPERERLI